MNKIKVIFLSVSLITLSACSTVGGTLQGAGEDLERAGQYIRNVGK